MKSFLAIFITLLCILPLFGCGKQETPDSIINLYVELLSETEFGSLDQAAKKLNDFRDTYAGYTIANNAATELAELRKIKKALAEAEKLIRKGEMQKAEQMLAGLLEKHQYCEILRVLAEILLPQANDFANRGKFDLAREALRKLRNECLRPDQILAKNKLVEAIIQKQRKHNRPDLKFKKEMAKRKRYQQAYDAALEEGDEKREKYNRKRERYYKKCVRRAGAGHSKKYRKGIEKKCREAAARAFPPF